MSHVSQKGVTSNATKSTRMTVANLRDRAPDMDFYNLVDVISSQFVNQCQVCKHGGHIRGI